MSNRKRRSEWTIKGSSQGKNFTIHCGNLNWTNTDRTQINGYYYRNFMFLLIFVIKFEHFDVWLDKFCFMEIINGHNITKLMHSVKKYAKTSKKHKFHKNQKCRKVQMKYLAWKFKAKNFQISLYKSQLNRYQSNLINCKKV